MKSSSSFFRFFRTCLAGLLGVLICATAFGAAASKKVLIDLGHGQTAFTDAAGQENSRLAAYREMAAKQGADIVTTKEPLSAATLKGIDVLALMNPQTAFDDAAIKAVTDFVRAGGSLLVITDEERRATVKIAQMRLNEIIAPFGLAFTPDNTPDPHNCGALAPAGPLNRTPREIPFSGGRAVEGGTGYCFTLDRDGKPTTRAQAAFARTANGARIIAMGDAMPMLFLGRPDGVRLQGTTREDTLYWGKDAREFMADAIAWLLAR